MSRLLFIISVAAIVALGYAWVADDVRVIAEALQAAQGRF